jgi:CHC2 zinc finger
MPVTQLGEYLIGDVNFDAIRSTVDLPALVASDLGEPASNGRWPCPIHGGTGPNFSVKGKNWKCFTCARSGDVFDYVAHREGITVVAAAVSFDPSERFHTKLEVDPRTGTRTKAASKPPETPTAPRTIKATAPIPEPSDERRGGNSAWQDPEWQAAVNGIITEAQKALWAPEGRIALDWLRARGLMDATISRFRLGFLPQRRIVEVARAPYGQLTANRGITIPWVRPGSWYTDPSGPWIGCNVRLLPFGNIGDPLPKTCPKYIAITGSERGHGYPWPEATMTGEPAVICEGEFDSLIAWQEFGWIANVVTFGGAGQSVRRMHADARAFLASCPDWLLLFDLDAAGDSAAREFVRQAPHRSRRLYLPDDVNDLTDLHKSGASVLVWLKSEFSRFGWRWPVARRAS